MRKVMLVLPLVTILAAASTVSRAADALTSCSFVSTGGVAFGGYSVLSSAPNDSAGSMVIACSGVTGGDTIVVDLSAGSASAFTPRRMAGAGGGTLDYNLYTDASRQVVWGDGSSGTGHYGPVAPSEGQTTITVYGRIPARQRSAQAGAYGDTVTATILY